MTLSVKINVWFQDDPKGWFWDTSEDSGGFDRRSPNGPHDTRFLAVADAAKVFFSDQYSYTLEVEDGEPSHYIDCDRIESEA